MDAQRRKTNGADPPSLRLRRTGTRTVDGFCARRSRTAKSCGPDTPTLVSSWRRAQLRRVTVTTSPVTGESAKETVKTIARGMPGDSGVPVVTNPRAFYSHTRLRVHRAPGIPCALCFARGHVPAQLGRVASREGDVCLSRRHAVAMGACSSLRSRADVARLSQACCYRGCKVRCVRFVVQRDSATRRYRPWRRAVSVRPVIALSRESVRCAHGK